MALIFVCIGIFVAVAVVIAYILHWYEEERVKEFAAVAKKLGLEFFPEGDPELLESLGEFSLFRLGYAHKLKPLIRGRTQNLDAAIFNYRYTTGGGDASSTFQQTMICLESSSLDLPAFELRPSGFGRRLAKLFGSKHVEFQEYPSFAKKYVVRGDDEEALREFFSPEVIEQLESTEGLHVMGQGGRLVFYRPSKRLRGYELRPFLEEAFKVYGEFKHANPSEVP